MCPRHVEDNVLFNIEIKNTVTDCFSQVKIRTSTWPGIVTMQRFFAICTVHVNEDFDDVSLSFKLSGLG